MLRAPKYRIVNLKPIDALTIVQYNSFEARALNSDRLSF